ncbi:MAG: tail fiber domain-containing protein [Oligoflexus sp.]|nr:tail fiber domain-containing protein [Pseudopedobacter sp.]
MKNYKKFIGLALVLVVCSISSLKAQNNGNNQIRINEKPVTNPLKRITSLEAVIFNYNTKKYKGVRLPANQQYGFEMEGLATQFPNLIKTNAKDYPSGKNSFKKVSYKDVDVANLVPVLVAAIKEQQIQLENLIQEVNLLKSK